MLLYKQNKHCDMTGSAQIPRPSLLMCFSPCICLSPCMCVCLCSFRSFETGSSWASSTEPKPETLNPKPSDPWRQAIPGLARPCAILNQFSTFHIILFFPSTPQHTHTEKKRVNFLRTPRPPPPTKLSLPLCAWMEGGVILRFRRCSCCT